MNIISRKEAKAKNLKRYFTGVPCTKNHTSERFTSNYLCVECHYENLRKADRKEYFRNYQKNRRASDPSFRIGRNLRKRIWKVLKLNLKSDSCDALLGCSYEELKGHIESKFEDGMSWDNYGEWHLDHIKPCSLFDLSLEDQQRECFNYTNLQPLWAKDNLSKGNKFKINC